MKIASISSKCQKLKQIIANSDPAPPKQNSIISIQIILFTQNFSIIFPLTEDSQVENHWPGKIRIVRIGIITKRRIKLHDILLLSRFPLIK